MGSLSRNTKMVGRRRCFCIFEGLHRMAVVLPDAVECAVLSGFPNAAAELLCAEDSALYSERLLRFQRDVTAAALAVDAQQNFFVRLQFLTDGDEILCVFDRLLIYFLDHVSLTQTSFASRRVGINFCDYGTLNVLWKIQRRANVAGDVSYRDSTENSSFLRLRVFFGRCFGTFLGRARRHLSKLYIERFRLTFAIHFHLRPTARRH